jgi:hypothetical protein
MIYSKKPILSAIVLFFVSFVIFLFNVACEGMFPVSEPEPVNYTITASAGAHGSIDPEGRVVVSDGEEQVFIIIPDAGYQIDEVLINGDSIGIVEEYTFTNINKDYTIAVIFKKKYTTPSISPVPANYILTASAGDGGTIEPSGEIKVKKGDNQSFTITPDICHQIEKIFVNESEVEAEAPYTYTIENIQQDCSIEVSFLLSDKKIRRYNQNEELQKDDYSSIKEAITDDDATDGDIIIVCPGSYSENIVFDGSKKITLRSVEPENEDIVSATIIDGGLEGSVTTFINGDESTLQGFTLTNGSGTSTGTYTAGGGIYISSSNPNIHYNSIEDNEAANGAGIFITGNSSPEIKENVIRNNKSENAAGGGIYIYGGSPDIIGNTITLNSAHTNGGGIHIYDSAPHISGNTINNNSADNGGGIYIEESYSVETDNKITGNSIKSNSANHGGGFYIINSNPEVGGVDGTDTDNFNNICGNSPDQIKSDTGLSYPNNNYGYTVTLSVNHGEYGTVTGEGNYCDGNLVQIEATPGDGYYFVNWTDDEGNEISIDNPYSFAMPAEDIIITANFEKN